MNSGLVKVLLIDHDPERRKERISILKNNGYKIFPALYIQPDRCKPGVYDLIVVNSIWQPETALEFCDSIRVEDPAQAILLMVGTAVQLPRRDYMVSDTPEQLLERIESMFKKANIVKAA